LLTEDGKIYTGCNIENASYGATVCAERVAVFNAVSAGEKRFKTMAVFTETDKLPVPCGICRQVLWELAGDVELVVQGGGTSKNFQLSDLVPNPFV
jgi:cytidine deaminase